MIQVTFIVLTLIISSCSDSKRNTPVKIKSPIPELEGVWKLTYAKLIYPDTIMEATISDQKKLLVGGRFAIGYYNPDSTLFAGGGTYDYDGQTYTENIEYSTNDVVDQAVQFDMTLKKSVWSLTGTVLVEEGDSIVELKLEEVWVRVE